MPPTCRGRKAEERAGPLSRYDDTWILRVLCSLLATVRPHVLAQTVRTGCSRVRTRRGCPSYPAPSFIWVWCRIHAVLGIWNMTSPARYLWEPVRYVRYIRPSKGLHGHLLTYEVRTDAGGWKQDVTIRTRRRSPPPHPKEPSTARIPSTNSPEDAPSSEPDHRRTARGEGGRECERTGSIRPQWLPSSLSQLVDRALRSVPAPAVERGQYSRSWQSTRDI
jgi:hypothetical protein